MRFSKYLVFIGLGIALIIGFAVFMRLSSDEAKNLALQLANEQSFAQFKIKPFQNGAEPKFMNGRWVWSGISSGLGKVDVSAEVTFDAYGSKPSVKVFILASEGSLESIFKNLDDGGGEP